MVKGASSRSARDSGLIGVIRNCSSLTPPHFAFAKHKNLDREPLSQTMRVRVPKRPQMTCAGASAIRRTITKTASRGCAIEEKVSDAPRFGRARGTESYSSPKTPLKITQSTNPDSSDHGALTIPLVAKTEGPARCSSFGKTALTNDLISAYSLRYAHT